MFKHDFFPSCHLVQEHTDAGRYYLTPDGLKLRSVTRVLEENQSEDKRKGLEKWRERIGEDKAARILTQAGRRGNIIHDTIEKYLLNNPKFLVGLMPVNMETVIKFLPALNDNLGKIYAIEHQLYSTRLMAAGTVDCIGWWNKKISVVDFKTSRSVKKKEYIGSYFLQATAYALMCLHRYDVWPEQIVILMATDYEKDIQIFVEKTGTYVNDVLDMFNDVKEAS